MTGQMDHSVPSRWRRDGQGVVVTRAERDKRAACTFMPLAFETFAPTGPSPVHIAAILSMPSMGASSNEYRKGELCRGLASSS